MNNRESVFLLWLLFLPLSLGQMSPGQEPPPEKQPADVAGKWTIYSKAADGETATKYIELKQNGNTIIGHFKSPNQSGDLEGTMNEQHIVFRTKTRWVFAFRGKVDGDYHPRRNRRMAGGAIQLGLSAVHGSDREFSEDRLSNLVIPEPACTSELGLTSLDFPRHSFPPCQSEGPPWRITPHARRGFV